MFTDGYLFWCEYTEHKYDYFLFVPAKTTGDDETARKGLAEAEKRAKETAAIRVQYAGFCRALKVV